jgi:predicted Zn-dependent peptidase
MRDLENMGAVVGSSVDREKITYSVTCLPEKAEEAIAAVSEVLTSAPTSAYVVDESKDVADLFVAAHKGCPKSQALELLYEAAYGENTPMGTPVYTSLADTAAASVSSFRKANFYAGNVVVSASGISIDSLRTMAELYLHGLPSDPPGTLLPIKASPYVGGDMKTRDNSVGSSHLALGFPVPKGAAGEAYKVLAQALSSKIASMPVPKDSVACFLHQGASGGLLGIYSHGQAAAATGFLEAAVAELKAIATAGAGTESAKVKTALDAFLALEGGKTGATVLLDATLSGTSPVADSRKVTPASVSSAAKAALAAAPAYAVYGVTAGTPSYAAVTKMTKA